MHPLIRTLIFTIFVPGTVTVLIPRWLLGLHPRPIWSGWHAAGGALIACGAMLYLWCGWHFAMRGRGTPGPWDAPKKLVVSGPYRYVRNPMYVGVSTVLLGESVLFNSSSVLMLLLTFMLAVNAFIYFYEEPALRSMFAAQYVEYCRHVRRWIPRLRPWSPPA